MSRHFSLSNKDTPDPDRLRILIDYYQEQKDKTLKESNSSIRSMTTTNLIVKECDNQIATMKLKLLLLGEANE